MRRPGYLRNLSDSWTEIVSEQALANRTTQALERESTDFIDTRSGAARVAPMRGILSPPAGRGILSPPAGRLSSPEFLLKHARWYDEYRRKVLS